MRFSTLYLLAALFVAVMFPLRAVAQEDEEDYRLYKFYKDDDVDDDDLLSWFATEVDSLLSSSAGGRSKAFSNSEYALSTLGFAPRGESRFSHSYIFEGVDISYSTSRMLSQLSLETTNDAGIGGINSSLSRTTRHSYHSANLRSRGHRFGVNISGRNYLMAVRHSAAYRLTKSDLELDDDWLLSEYFRINTGRDLYVDGLFSNGVEAAVSLSRRWRNNSLFMAVTLPWLQRTMRPATTEEAVVLTGNRGYNPAWGMQNGKMRSSRINNTTSPTFIASWQRRLGMWTTMRITAIGELSYVGRTALAWCDAMTPMPDNYRYMPSYFTAEDDHRVVDNAWRYNDLRYMQIAWDDLYHTNALQRDGHAAYFVECRRRNALNGSVVVDFTTQFRGLELEYGVRVSCDSRREFKVVDDLLGADHVLDIDYFVRDDATYGTRYHNNLRSTTIKRVAGQRFGYDYRLTESSVSAYGIARWNISNMDFEVSVDLATSSIHRRGYFEKELFAAARSYGRSRSVVLMPASLNVAWSYTFGRNALDVHAVAVSRCPESESLFLQANYNNRIVDAPRLSTSVAAEVGYRHVAQRFSVGAHMFASYHANECDVLHYYDDLADEYVDAVVSKLARINYGFEIDASVRWSQYLSSQAQLNIGRYRFAKDAAVRAYADDDNDLVYVSRSAIRGLNTSMPELSSYVDLAFKRGGWQATASLCYVGSRYVSPSVVRRTERIISYTSSAEERSSLLEHQSIGDAVSLGVNISKSLSLNDVAWLYVSFSIDNLLGAENIYSGYEQHRIRTEHIGQMEHVRPFDNKLNYGYGRTFRVNLSIGF